MRFLGFLFFIVCNVAARAQADSATHQQFIDTLAKSTPFISVGNIIIKGNKRTQPYIILREMSLHQGETINLKDLNKKLEQSRNQVLIQLCL